MRYLSPAVLCAALIFLSFEATTDASAQTLRVSLEQLEEASDAVVVGRTVGKESYWNLDRSAILTKVVIQVQDPVTGAVTGQEEITVPGGQVGEYLHEVSDQAVFMVDEDVVVFMSRHASGLMIVAGGAQGKMEIVRDAQTGERTVRGAAHLMQDQLDVAGKRVSVEGMMDVDEAKATVPLEDFVKRVRKLN